MDDDSPIRASHLRRGRVSVENGTYLVTVCVAGRRHAFEGWANAGPVIDAMKAEGQCGSAKTLAWVLMPDHFHWLLSLGAVDLNVLVRRFKSRSSRAFKQRFDWPGPLWQKNFHDRALRRDDDVAAAARYVLCNPIRAGLVDRVGDYPLWDAVWI